MLLFRGCFAGNGSVGLYAGRLVFFFGPGVREGWDRASTANLAAADANWATLIANRSIPPIAPGDPRVPQEIRACFNTEFLWCLGPEGQQPPPFPACGSPKPVEFGPPRLVDHDQMPTDFLAWTPDTDSLLHGRNFGEVNSGESVDNAVLLGREFNIMSTDNGETWGSSHAATPNRTFNSVIHFFPRHCPSNNCRDVTTIGRLNTSSTSTSLFAVPAYQFKLRLQPNGSLVMQGTRLHPGIATFTGLPRPIQNGTHGLSLGGTTSLILPENRGYLLTAIVRWASPYQPLCPTNLARAASIIPCNRSSVVVFHSENGTIWNFLSVIADTHDYPESHEGPNENDMTLLPDGKTLLAILRLDGGDGGLQPPREPYYYLPYHRTISKDWGRTWTKLVPISNAGCVRPRLVTIGWTTLLTGGRFRYYGNTSDVLLWASYDGRGEEWTPYSISYHHNVGAAAWRGTLPYDWKVNASNTTNLGPRETNGYTSIVQLNSTAAIIFYDQKNGSAEHAYHTQLRSYSMVVHL